MTACVRACVCAYACVCLATQGRLASTFVMAGDLQTFCAQPSVQQEVSYRVCDLDEAAAQAFRSGGGGSSSNSGGGGRSKGGFSLGGRCL